MQIFSLSRDVRINVLRQTRNNIVMCDINYWRMKIRIIVSSFDRLL